MAKKKATTNKKKEETPKKKATTKKTTEKKYTLVELCRNSTMPDNELILNLVDSGYYNQYKTELQEGGEPSLTEQEFIKKVLRRE